MTQAAKSVVEVTAQDVQGPGVVAGPCGRAVRAVRADQPRDQVAAEVVARGLREGVGSQLLDQQLF